MGILTIIKGLILRHQRRRLLSQPGDYGLFNREGGNDLLVSNLGITENDLVLDVGGYHGAYAAEILVRYGAKIIIYEPVPNFFSILHKKYKENNRVVLKNYGLTGSKRTSLISNMDNASSLHLNIKDGILVELEDVFNEMSSLNSVALLKINIEGGEYELLERLLDTNQINKCRTILVQFHKQPEDYLSRYSFIQKRLTETHDCVFKYYMVWEKWVLKTA